MSNSRNPFSKLKASSFVTLNLLANSSISLARICVPPLELKSLAFKTASDSLNFWFLSTAEPIAVPTIDKANPNCPPIAPPASPPTPPPIAAAPVCPNNKGKAPPIAALDTVPPILFLKPA